MDSIYDQLTRFVGHDVTLAPRAQGASPAFGTYTDPYLSGTLTGFDGTYAVLDGRVRVAYVDVCRVTVNA